MDDISLVKAAAAAEEGAAMNGSAAPDAATAAAAADAAAAAPGAAVPQRRRRWGCGCFSIGAAGSGDDSGTYDEAEAFRTLGAVMLAERAAALAAAAASPGRAARAKAFAIAAVRKLSSYTSFLPMVLIAALPDLRVAALAAACAAAGNFLLSVELRALGVYRVWPKVFDIVNLVVYLAVFIATTFCPRPMALLTPVAVAGANAVYFGGSLVGRPFSDELARESAPEGFWANPAFRRLNWRISAAWAAALWVVALAAAAYAAIYSAAGQSPGAYLALDVALGVAPLLAAVACQHTLAHRFRRRVRAAAVALAGEQRQGQEQQGGGGGGGAGSGDGKDVGGAAAAV